MPRDDLRRYIPYLTESERLRYEFEYGQAKWCRQRWKVHYYEAEEILRQARARARQTHKEAAE